MGDSHQMVVHHIGKIISGIAVRLNQNHIVKLRVIHRDISVDIVVEGSLSLSRVILTNYIGLACGKIRLHFLFRQMQTVLVVDVDLLARHRLRQRCQSLLITKAIICLAFLDQLFRVFQINTLLLAVALHIGTYTAVLVRTFVVQKPRVLQRAVNDVHRSLHIPLLIRILNAKDKIPALVLRNQIGVKRRP